MTIGNFTNCKWILISFKSSLTLSSLTDYFSMSSYWFTASYWSHFEYWFCLLQRILTDWGPILFILWTFRDSYPRSETCLTASNIFVVNSSRLKPFHVAFIVVDYIFWPITCFISSNVKIMKSVVVFAWMYRVIIEFRIFLSVFYQIKNRPR